MKIIFHLDLDCYFASAETSVNPSLKGKKVVVSGKGLRGIIAACSYEARSVGIRAAMPLYKAYELAKDIVVVKPNYELYTVLSSKLFEYISSKYTNKIEVASIDECYIDVTSLVKNYNDALVLAKKMQTNIMKDLKLPASIGISDNKFVAKMASPLNKPYGIAVLPSHDFLNRFKDEPLIRFHGVGKPTEKVFHKLNITTIGQLSKADPNVLFNLIGKLGPTYVEMANGKGSDVILLDRNELKSIGNSLTFQDFDKDNRHDILNILKDLVFRVSHRAKVRNLVGRTISVSIKVSGGHEIKPIRKQKILDEKTNDMNKLFKEAVSLFDQLWNEGSIKFIGVSISNLINILDNKMQISIFDEDKRTNIEQIMDSINDKLGKKSVMSGKDYSQIKGKQQNQSRFLEIERTDYYYKKTK